MFIRKYWKLIAASVALVLLLTVILVAVKVISFIGDTTSASRSQDFETPTVNSEATTTAQARFAELFGTPAATPNAVGSPSATSTPVPVPTDNNLLNKIRNGERVSFLFMGFGGEGHEAAYLTDTLLVLSYDPKTKTVTEFNVPRDMWVFIPSGPKGTGFWGRINGAFSTIMKWLEPTQDKLDLQYHWTDDKSKQVAAANLTTNTVQKVLGFKIDHWVTMNFNGFRKLIDAMGGVDINVQRAFVDNDYPRNDDDQIDAGVMTIKFEAGLQHMDGERAIEFARSRKSESAEGGDPARSRRQMQVISAIKEKALKQNLAFDLLKYMDALQDNLRTTLSLDDLRALASYVSSEEGKALADSSKFDSEIMDGNNVLQVVQQPDYRLIPKEGQGKYSQLQQWVQNAITHPELRREQVRIQILNASGVTGVAGKWTDFMIDQGFRMLDADISQNLDKSVLMDYTNGVALANIRQIQKYFPNLKVVSQTADNKPYDGAPDLLLYLGKDYKSVTANGKTGN